MILIAKLELEIAYYDVRIKHISHYATEISPIAEVRENKIYIRWESKILDPSSNLIWEGIIEDKWTPIETIQYPCPQMFNEIFFIIVYILKVILYSCFWCVLLLIVIKVTTWVSCDKKQVQLRKWNVILAQIIDNNESSH